MIHQLTIEGVGPAARMAFEFGTRLNAFTGDNGLGKSFVLDCVWWAMTGSWPSEAALPAPPTSPKPAQISWVGQGKTGKPSQRKSSEFDRKSQVWRRPNSRPIMPGLLIYARVDGSFSVWDPVRNYWRQWESRELDDRERPEAYHFDRDQVWNGLQMGGQEVCNGLIRDWVSWQREPVQGEGAPFQLLQQALTLLSPHAGERMRPGEPRRVYLGDARKHCLQPIRHWC